MPEMHFTIEWPDGERETCYSPSYIVEEHLAVGQSYALDDFLARIGSALETASNRVRARYGFACSSAIDQLGAIQAKAEALPAGLRSGLVKVLAFEKRAPRDARADAKRPAATAPVEAAPRGVSVVVVGGGQAGLAVSYCLKEAGVDHVVLEKARVGNSWRTQRWDTFCLVTPNWQCQLPGYRVRRAPTRTGSCRTTKSSTTSRATCGRFDPPLREGVSVRSLERRPEGGFVVETSDGTYIAEQVVVATGGYHVPRIPDASQGTARRHRAAALGGLPQPRMATAGGGARCRHGSIRLPDCRGPLPRRAQGAPRCRAARRDARAATGARTSSTGSPLMGHYDMPIEKHPNKEQARDKTNHYVTGRDGGRDIDLRQFALEGMRLYGPLESITEGRGRLRAGPQEEPRRRRRRVPQHQPHRSTRTSKRLGSSRPAELTYVPPWEPDVEPSSLDVRPAGIRAVVWCVGLRRRLRMGQAPRLRRPRLPAARPRHHPRGGPLLHRPAVALHVGLRALLRRRSRRAAHRRAGDAAGGAADARDGRGVGRVERDWVSSGAFGFVRSRSRRRLRTRSSEAPFCPATASSLRELARCTCTSLDRSPFRRRSPRRY